MRSQADAESVRRFARALGRAAVRPTRLYLVGGATAVFEGWRASTIDIDVRLDPDDLARDVSRLKEELNLNVEFASPADFLPELPGWEERSLFLFSEGHVQVFHYDLYSQALAKLERGFATDLADVDAMVRTGRVNPEQLAGLLLTIEDELYRFPAVEPAALRHAVDQLLSGSP